MAVALFLGLVATKKMLEMEGTFAAKRTNTYRAKVNYHHSGMMLRKDSKELPDKNVTIPEEEVTVTEDYIEKNLEDYYDVQLFSKIYVGSNKQQFDLIFDTGSGWTWVQGESCNGCPTRDRFDIDESTTYSKVSNFPEFIQYGTGAVRGEHGQDQVCITTSACAQNTSILVINQAWDLEGLTADGIMGMSPTQQDSGAELLIEELYNQQVIDDKVFSIQVGDMNEPSKITIGGYDTEKFAKGDLYWHNLTNPMYWTLEMEGASLGGVDLELDTREVIIDSGTSYLLMPESDFNNFRPYFDSRYTCMQDPRLYNLFVCECSYSEYLTFPDLTFTINGQVYTLTKENYAELYGRQIIFKIMVMDFTGYRPFWIMGLTFFHNYYTVFDQENFRIGFAESKLSSLPDVRLALALSNVSAPSSVNVSLIVSVSVVGFALLALAAVTLARRKRSEVSESREVFLRA